MNSKELEKYVEEYINGNQEAFVTLYEETYKNVYYTIYLVVKNKSLIDDYVQDTYLKVIDKIKTNYTVGTNFKAWVSTIAHNIAVNGIIKSNKEVSFEITPETEMVFGATKEKDERMEKAMAYLTGDEREVFIHLIIEGFDVKETAKMMNVNINRIYYLQSKMKKSLQFIFEKY